ncbi:hypothetical protein NRIC_31950 [Enterococcus florum]|uniref:Mga helix-turn-helix domain-containing protein n=1 Tax=Enterococcus florum TaxID=2480627 RepID=A0A4P5PF07_9ENTE|nr:helix-turn-helix domain-containing protein [Enterococcus florum]GCF95304.1 hypothetical protein NRIC_31950 [Enterococcus florum]
MLQDVLLTNTEKKKIDFFYRMETVPVGEYTIHTLSKKLKMNYVFLQQLLLDLDKELIEIGEQPLLIDQKKKLLWDKEASRLDNYLVHLWHRSIPYQFLLWSLVYPEKKLADFCAVHSISETTAVRRLKPFVTYLSRYEITVNVASMQLTGRESILRLMYIKFLWICSSGTDLSMAKQSFEAEKKLAQELAAELQDHIHQQLVFLLLGVCRLRNETGNWLAVTPFEELLFPKAEQQVRTYLKSFLEDSLQVTRNVEFINYLIYYYPYAIDCQSQAAQPLLMYYQKNLEEGHSLYLAIETFYHQSLLEWMPALEDYKQKETLMSNIITTFLNYSIQKNNVPLLFKPTQEQSILHSEQYTVLFPKVKRIVLSLSRRNGLEWMGPISDSMARSLSLALMPFYQLDSKKRKRKVGLVAINDPLQRKQLDYFFKKFDFVETIYDPSPNEAIDLYVTHSADLLTDTQQPYFLIDRLKGHFESELVDFLFDTY